MIALAAGGVDRHVLFQRAGEDAEKAHLGDEGVNSRLKDLSDERPLRCRNDRHFFAGGVLRLSRQFERRQREAGQRVHQLGHSDSRLGADEQNRNQRSGGDRLGESRGNFLGRQRFAVEIPLHQRFIGFDDRVHDGLVPLGRVGGGAGRDGRRNFQSAHHAADFRSESDGQVHRHAGVTEGLADRVNQSFEVDIFEVALGDNDHPSQTGRPGEVEGSPRIHFDSGCAAQRDDGRFDAPQAADRLSDEIGIARRVDDIDVLAAVFEVNQGRGDRVLMVLGFFVRIQNAAAVFDGAGPGRGAGFKQHQVRERRLADCSVPDECHVADLSDCMFGHKPSVSCMLEAA